MAGESKCSGQCDEGKSITEFRMRKRESEAWKEADISERAKTRRALFTDALHAMWERHPSRTRLNCTRFTYMTELSMHTNVNVNNTQDYSVTSEDGQFIGLSTTVPTSLPASVGPVSKSSRWQSAATCLVLCHLVTRRSIAVP